MRKPNRRIEISSTQLMLKARALKALRWPMRLTHLGMIAEQGVRAFWPLWSWMFVIWTVLSFNILQNLSVELAYVLALLGVSGVVGALIYGGRRFRWPGPDQAADRIDRSLENRPLTALWDAQAIGAEDGGSTTVWRAHMARMAEQAAEAKRVEPDLRLSDRDPYGLRYIAATALVVAILFGSINRNSLEAALNASAGEAQASGSIYEGWIEPPRYTGLPGIYLNDVTGLEPLPIPTGSKITLRLYGQTDGLTFVETVSGTEPEADAGPTDEFDFLVSQSGELRIQGAGDNRVWSIIVIPDETPMIALTGPLERSPKGETKLSFEAADDYGVVAGTATLSLDTEAVDRRYGLALPPETRPDIGLDIPLPFSGDTREFTDTLVEDLSLHPWAGLPVILKLSAVDDLDQMGFAEPESILLPGRRFFDPLAAAIVEQRRDLLWNRENASRVAMVLRTVSHLPEDIFDNESAYLILRTAIRRLENRAGGPLKDTLRDEIADLLWQSALLIEDGNLSDAEARLRRAEERLSEAIENGATDEEIAELTEELRRAMQEYMEQLARDAEENPGDQQQMGEMREITSDQLQEMLDKIQELTREGRMEEAQQMLDQLRQMMENMRTARREQGEGQGQGQQSMRDLADTMRQQQDLSDDAFRQMQEEFNKNGQPGQPGQQGEGQQQQPGRGENGEPRGNTPGQADLAQRQDALRQLLEDQRNGLADPNSEEGRFAREALRRAEREMGEAGEALRQGDLPEALDNQAEVLEALREGLENLGQEIARNQDQNMGQQGDQAGSPNPNSNRDPLGRQSGTTGRIGSEQDLMPGDNPVMRSRELLEEIRRRSGDKSRPRLELEYLERLLDRF